MSDFSGQNTQEVSIIDDYVLQMWETFQLSRGTHEVEHKHVDEIIEEDVRETNVGTFLEVTDIAKIVRKEIRFWILQMKTHKVGLVKNVKKKNVFDFTDENSYKRQSFGILKIRNKWCSFSD